MASDSRDEQDQPVLQTASASGDRQILTDLLDAVRDVVWITTGDGGAFLFINSAVEQVYGLTREVFMANPMIWLDVVHPEDRERVQRESDPLGLGASSVELEYRIIWPDGSIRWLRDRKIEIRDAQGRALRLGGIAADITDTKGAEELLRGQHEQLERDFAARTEQLRRAEKKYRSLFENAGDPIYSITPQGEIAALNEAWERTTGHPREAWIGQPFGPIVHPEELQLTQRCFQAALAGEPCVFEARYRAADGRYRLAEHTLAPQIDSGGQVIEVVGIARDITERRTMQREQRQFDERMQQIQKLESLGLLAGGIAHDFNNLLMGVLGEADLALVDLPVDAPLRPPLETIRDSAQHLADMANQMLAYSGKGQFLVTRMDLSTVVFEMVRLLRSSLSKQVTLSCELCDAPLQLEADASQLRQVVMNLITNAAEAMEAAGGSVQIRTAATVLEQALLPEGWPGEPLDPGRYLVLEVSDAGAGMDSQTLSRIFEPFFTSKATGRGLGLAAVFGIIRGHGGAIEVESQPGEGTTFRVYFRSADEPGQVSPSGHDADVDAELVRGSETVLVVDDEPVALRVASEILVRAGYTVLTAADGQEALELLGARERQVQLVVLDLTMPRLDGPATFRELHRRWPTLRVIVTSGYGQVQVSSQMRREATFLQKPYRAAPFTRAVRRALSKVGGEDV
jgi:PAS domain S-box-containing protein